eukprot:7860229-Alexandrium_andersonii.AAC.1
MLALPDKDPPSEKFWQDRQPDSSWNKAPSVESIPPGQPSPEDAGKKSPMQMPDKAMFAMPYPTKGDDPKKFDESMKLLSNELAELYKEDTR